MRILANTSVCIGAGQCVFTDPEAFDQDDSGFVVVLRPEPKTAAETARAKEAVNLCPSRALSLAEVPAS
ncbi:ferredoxin [Tomitella biformata]|uniref:ferredoxin n=1 Tax=Tomitella biformata TaxID=630403 RepID=UPI000467AA59|nr:(4Fe-4S)-binding protein [Tomitella biformata]